MVAVPPGMGPKLAHIVWVVGFDKRYMIATSCGRSELLGMGAVYSSPRMYKAIWTPMEEGGVMEGGQMEMEARAHGSSEGVMRGGGGGVVDGT